MKLLTPAKISALMLLGSALATTAATADDVATGMYYSSKNLKVVEQVLPAYPRYKELSGKDGYAVVDFTVNADGSVAAPAIRDSSSGVFSKAALTAIYEWQFEPVLDASMPIPVRSSMKFSFVPREQ